MVVLAAGIEAEIQQLPAGGAPGFLECVGLDEPGLHKVVRAGYRLLGLQTFFTVGEKECRAWTIHKGWKAPQAAGVIHTDFERGLHQGRGDRLGGPAQAAAARPRSARRACSAIEGKEYVVQDGDCMHFRFNV